MSTLQRFLSASAAGWAKIFLTAGSQLVLVPIFLGHWSVEEYGCWLVIQTIVSLSSIMSAGHQNFVGFEFLKVGDKRPDEFRVLFYSAVPWVLLIAALELLVLVGLIYLGLMRSTFDPHRSLSEGLLHQAFGSLLLYSVAALITSVGGLAGRAVAPYGYFPRMTWWQTYLGVVGAITSGVAVAAGADLLQTSICTVLVGIAFNIPIHLDLWRMFRRHGIHPVRPDRSTGFRNFSRSVAIALTTVLDIFRQQGVRVLLSSTIGISGMTAFATTRTMSNLSLQGIGTITAPVMPEIMRFLRERDAERTNAIIGFVWALAVVTLAPVLIVFQWIMPVVYHYWTRGKIGFNPMLFGLFSISLLIFALARPLIAILQGNNLLKVQLYISIGNSVIAVAGILLFSGIFGVSGAATALLIAELAATILSAFYAKQWLERNGIRFPWELLYVALTSIAVAAIAILSMVMFQTEVTPILVVSMVVNCFIAVAYYRRLPPLAVAKMRGLLRRRNRGS
ncbi:MAG: putative Polysaccharide biosynthesis protein [Gammaproteobacteria bacterium]|nr:putative Polysaccharide biosynthesis protein [Gammaproteobacteria bacterium]